MERAYVMGVSLYSHPAAKLRFRPDMKAIPSNVLH